MWESQQGVLPASGAPSVVVIGVIEWYNLHTPWQLVTNTCGQIVHFADYLSGIYRSSKFSQIANIRDLCNR
jgi:hypothetical protein